MGYRLTGSKVKSLARDAVSKPIPFGAIQLLPSGDPVIIMADGQTMGGYPVLGVVISIDRSVLAQLAPGGDMGFEELSLDEAQGLIYERAIRDYQLIQAIGDTPKW